MTTRLTHVCLSHPSPHLPRPAPDIQTAYQTKFKLDWRTGVAATDWNAIAKKEHLDALTVELRKLEVGSTI